MKKTLPLLMTVLLASCQTIRIGMNPAPDANAFLDALKNQDISAIKNSVASGSDVKNETLTKSLEKIQNSDSAASKSAKEKISKLEVVDCYMGSDRSICKLSNDSELVLKKDGLAWKVDLEESTFSDVFEKDMQSLFRAEQPPEYVTIQFTLALLEGNLEQAKEYSTDRTHLMLPLIVGMMSAAQQDQSEEQKTKMDEARKELSSMACEVSGDRAECAPEGKEKSMSLVRDNGVWKVDFRKGGDEDHSEEDDAESMDSEESDEEM